MESNPITKETERLFWNELHRFQVHRTDAILQEMSNELGDGVLETIKELKIDWSEPLRLYLKNIASILEKLKEEYGDKVIQVIKKHSQDIASEQGMNISKGCGNTLDDLLTVFGTSGEIIFKDETEALIRREGCPVAKASRELGIEDLMYYLHCYMDTYRVRGINPNISCKHNKTYMEGDNYCEYHLRVTD